MDSITRAPDSRRRRRTHGVAMQTNTTTHRAASTSAEARVRSVESVHRAGPFHWVGDGFRVQTVFPSPNLPQARTSPFLLLDHHPTHDYAPLPEGQRGVGWHPHRGFETVTLAWEGSVAHRDTAGHEGVIDPGDVQWMTAASGVLHEEYHERAFSRRGGPFHMMQLWVNLPRDRKMGAPDYQPITAAEIPVVTLEGDAGQVRVIAGEYAGERGPARTFTPITMLDVRLRGGRALEVPLPAGHNAFALVETGRLSADGERVGSNELVLFANDGGASVAFRAEEDAHVVLLAGEPIDEPIVHYGPFVMNSQHEIVQAIRDFEAGRLGAIPR
jgi:redox-sensitive bicupin YhaK (pirin superfamily)